MLKLVGWLLLLTLTTTSVSCHRTVDTNYLLNALFDISREDSEYMDNLTQQFISASGEIDKK
ncbi:hypothetical protein COOONC_01667 [Cooperia oncophora]